MKIRTLTLFYNLKKHFIDQDLIRRIEILKKIYDDLKEKGIEVQTLRVSTNLASQKVDFKTMISMTTRIDDILRDKNIEFFNIGKVNYLKIENVLKLYEKVNISSFLDIDTNIFDEKVVQKGATLIKELSKIDPIKNFNFGLSFNIQPGTPFFPSSYSNKEGFSVGFENGDLLQSIFKDVKNYDKLKNYLEKKLNKEYLFFEKLFKNQAKKRKIEFLGLDISFAPGIKKEQSVYEAFNILKKNIKRKNLNDLSIAGAITEVLKNLKLKKTGYSGLMLPLCEDYSLSRLSFENNIRIRDLLLLSSVCGCGIDTVPVKQKNEFIESLIIDSYTISRKWKKPLQLRVLPVEEKNIIRFSSKYLLKSKLLDY